MAGILTRGQISSYVKFLVDTGCIISSTNYVSAKMIVFTEVFYSLELNDQGRYLVNEIKTPKLKSFARRETQSRLPRQKVIPSSWTRGTSASTQLFIAKSDSKVLLNFSRGMKLSLFWTQCRFLDYVRKLGLPVHLPRIFGGFAYPCGRNSRENPKNIRLVQLLTRADQSADSFFDRRLLASIFSIESYSPLGKAVGAALDKLIHQMRSSSSYSTSFISLSSFTSANDLPLYTMSNYFENPDSLWDVVDKTRQQGFVLAYEFFDFVESILWAQYSPIFARGAVNSPPSLSRVAKRFKLLRDKILSKDPQPYHKYAKFSLKKDLSQRIFFLKSCVLVKRSFAISNLRHFMSTLVAPEFHNGSVEKRPLTFFYGGNYLVDRDVFKSYRLQFAALGDSSSNLRVPLP